MPKILFSAENAAEFARLSHIKRKERAAAEAANALLPHADSLPSALPSQVADDFSTRRLLRVRKQLGLIDKLIEDEATSNEPDGNKLDRLASASIKLSELARVLKGDPLPGSLRPTKASSRRAPGGPVVPE